MRFTILFLFLSVTFAICEAQSGVSSSKQHHFNVDTSKNKQAKAYLQLDLKDALSTFCDEYYNKCFKERRYVNNSLNLDDKFTYTRFSKTNNTYKVTGTHSYKGRFGKLHQGVNFKADITVTEYKTYNQYHVKFYKADMPDLSHSDIRWEICEQSFQLKK